MIHNFKIPNGNISYELKGFIISTIYLLECASFINLINWFPYGKTIHLKRINAKTDPKSVFGLYNFHIDKNLHVAALHQSMQW